MKRRTVLLGAGAFAAIATTARAQPLLVLHDAPRPMLSPTFVDEKGRDLNLSDFLGRVLLVNVWATWCPPCRGEMPSLDRLQRQLGGPDFHILPISIDTGGISVARSFLDEIGTRDLTLYWGEDIRVKLALATFGLPTTLLVDRSGMELGRVIGPVAWDSPGAMRQLRKAIGNG